MDTFEEEPVDLDSVVSELAELDNDLEKVNAEILGFRNELGIVPPFKVVD